MPVNTELLNSLLAPVPGDNPSGLDLRYDAAYDEFKEERREDLLLPGSDNADRKIADWARVVSMGTDLIARKTKDLQLGAWLTEALLRRQGISGLITGIEAMRGMLEQFWETLYPEMEDGDLELRIGPLEWLGSRLTPAIQLCTVGSGGITFLDHLQAQTVPREDAISEAAYDNQKVMRAQRAEAESLGKKFPEDIDAAIDGTSKEFYRQLTADVNAAIASLAALEKVSDERFGRDAPAYTDIRSTLAELGRFAASVLAAKLETDPDPADASVEQPDAAGGSGPSVSPDGGGNTQSREPASVQDASQRLAAVAAWYRKQNPTDPAPFAMLRGFRWGELRGSAPEVDPRLLEAPATAIRAKLKTLMLDGNWADLLEQSEQLMATPAGRGWLDLQRYVLTACINLGDSYGAISAVLRSELRALLLAVPALPRMTLMDDTPAANDETREWLNAEIMTDSVVSGAESSGSGDGESDSTPIDGADSLTQAMADNHPLLGDTGARKPSSQSTRGAAAWRTDAFVLARNELALGRSNRAIEILTSELERDSTPRGRFIRQTQIAFVMVEAGLHAVARPVLERLVEIITERSLEQWESASLVAQPIALLYKVLLMTDGDSSTRNQLYLRVCRLDPLQAMTLKAP